MKIKAVIIGIVTVFVAGIFALALFLYFNFPEIEDATINNLEEELNNFDLSEARWKEPMQISFYEEKFVHQEASFVAQAPFGEWDDPVFQDACEETASLIAVSWAVGESFTPAEAKQIISNIADYEQQEYGSHIDTSANDTLQRIIYEYFEWQLAWYEENIELEDIKREIFSGNVVIVPTDGQKLGNSNYRDPGPERHALVIIGYDPETREFITHDPGTRRGANYRYLEEVLYNAVRDYPTGNKLPINEVEKNMIVIAKLR